MNATATAWVVGCILICGAVTVGVLIVLLHAAVDWLWQRAHARRAMDEGVSLVCKPCGGEPGTCTCLRKSDCTHPLCGAPDTAVSDSEFTRELRELLRKEEHRD